MTDVDLDRLSSVQDAFDKASDTDPDPFALPEPGDYGATVDSFDIIDSSKGLLFKTTLTIINDQQYACRQVDTIHNLEDQKRIDYLKSHLAKLGANTACIRLAEDLRPGSDFLRGLLDVVVEIAIKDSKKVNPNIVHSPVLQRVRQPAHRLGQRHPRPGDLLLRPPQPGVDGRGPHQVLARSVPPLPSGGGGTITS